MQGNTERKPKHACPDCSIEPFRVCDAHGGPNPNIFYPADESDVPADVHDPADDAACNCDPLTDGYANIDCDTHGFPVVPRKGSLGRGSGLLG